MESDFSLVSSSVGEPGGGRGDRPEGREAEHSLLPGTVTTPANIILIAIQQGLNIALFLSI